MRRGADWSVDCSGWSDEELRKVFDEMVREGHSHSETWKLVGIFALIIFGGAQLVALLDRAAWWEIAIIVAGVVGAWLGHEHDRRTADRSRFLGDVRAEMVRRDEARDAAMRRDDLRKWVELDHTQQ